MEQYPEVTLLLGEPTHFDKAQQNIKMDEIPRHLNEIFFLSVAYTWRMLKLSSHVADTFFQ